MKFLSVHLLLKDDLAWFDLIWQYGFVIKLRSRQPIYKQSCDN